jgi:guanylate kinase
MTAVSKASTRTRRGLLIVISAPSGGGKSTVIRRLRDKHPEFLYSVSATTRERRKGERQGIHYQYMEKSEFESAVEKKQFVEWARVHDDYYGTPTANIERAHKRKQVMLFDLDVQGAESLRKAEPSVVSIFLLPPSWDVLKKRLEARGSESIARLRRRLKNARVELSRRYEYDYWVTNNRLANCVSDCEAIIRAEQLRRTD